MNLSQFTRHTLGCLALLLALPACQSDDPQSEARAQQAIRTYVQGQIEKCAGWRYVPGGFTRLGKFSDNAGTRFQMQHTYSTVWEKGDSSVHTITFFVDSSGTVYSSSLRLR